MYPSIFCRKQRTRAMEESARFTRPGTAARMDDALDLSGTCRRKMPGLAQHFSSNQASRTPVCFVILPRRSRRSPEARLLLPLVVGGVCFSGRRLGLADRPARLATLGPRVEIGVDDR